MSVLAVIPARGGSKSIPLKNIAMVAGRPLLGWTLEAARRCPALTRTVVSTDDRAIAEVARSLGAEVPFLRPAELAGDDTPGTLPIVHAVQWLAENEGCRPDYVVCLQPTSPLVTAEDIGAAVRLCADGNAEAVVSVTPAGHHPYWIKRVDEFGRLADFVRQDRPAARRQDLPPAFALNGAIYVVRRDVLLARQTLCPDHTLAYVMPHERSLDIDTPWDLTLADLILRAAHAGKA